MSGISQAWVIVGVAAFAFVVWFIWRRFSVHREADPMQGDFPFMTTQQPQYPGANPVQGLQDRVNQLEDILRQVYKKLNDRHRELEQTVTSMEAAMASLEKPFKAVAERCAYGSRLLNAQNQQQQQPSVAAPPSFDGNRIETLMVSDGDRVQAGQTIAVLDNHDRLKARLESARDNVRIAEARRNLVAAGAKTGDIEAQAARANQTRAELQGQIASQRATIATLDAQLNGERATQLAAIDRLNAELANANTDGYHRQVVHFRDRAPIYRSGHSFGTGVDVARIERVRDRFLETALRTNIADQGAAARQATSADATRRPIRSSA